MRKLALITVLGIFGLAISAQAVVVHWAADTESNNPIYTYSVAKLVYVSDGARPETEAAVASATVVDTASGNALFEGVGYTAGVWERSASDSTRSSGKYYVVLFDGGSAVGVSQNGLDYNDTDAITFNPLNPALDAYVPDQWVPVPEPSTYALIAIGAVAMLWGRRRKS